MSRTIRRNQKHSLYLLKWWLPKLQVVTTSRDDWRCKRLPGLLYSPYESKIVRRVQTDMHRFFCGPNHYSRNIWHRKYRQQSKVQLHHANLAEDWDDCTVARIYYPYMFY